MAESRQLESGVRPAGTRRMERMIVQCPAGTAGGTGGAAGAWADLAEIWGCVDMAPPRDIWPCQNDKDVALWVATGYRAGIAPGLRLLLRGEVFSIAEVVCAHGDRPGMWLRVIRGARAAGRAAG